jgi:hypothetical protein
MMAIHPLTTILFKTSLRSPADEWRERRMTFYSFNGFVDRWWDNIPVLAVMLLFANAISTYWMKAAFYGAE